MLHTFRGENLCKQNSASAHGQAMILIENIQHCRSQLCFKTDEADGFLLWLQLAEP